MRALLGLLLMSSASAALANSEPVLGPVPAWVKRVPLNLPSDTTAAPVRMILLDEQIDLTPGAVSRYSEVAASVQTAAGLSAGNIGLSWRPDVDTIAVHALTILRKGKLIDVLASQKFTILRRETNLEDASLDGRLTATLLIDGVEVGDVINLASSVVTRDPTFANHVETSLARWNGATIDHAHARLHWSGSIPLRLRSSAGLPAAQPTADATGKSVEFSADNVQPIIPPTGAPTRYAIGRVIEATDYRSWAELGALMAPLYRKAEAINSAGPVATEIASIRAASTDPLARAGAALSLVQSRIRYVALFMGEGGYVPAPAEESWANRRGDCKAKTALLLAMLHKLGIDAVPVAVSINGGDGVDTRLPMIQLFDHVLVRATINGKDYWLDGTRTGDRDLARLEVPDFHWGLPLVPTKAELVKLTPLPRGDPDKEFTLAIDARDGIFAPAKAHAEVRYRGDRAQSLRLAFDALPAANRDAALRQIFKQFYDFVEPAKLSATFDPATGIERIAMDGVATLKWDDSFLRVPGSGIGYAADFARPVGPDRDAPFATDYPSHDRSVTTIQLPTGIALWPGKVGHDVDQTLAGIAYHREASLTGTDLRMVKTTRTVAPEVDATTARAAQARLRALDDEDVYLKKGDYRASDADLTALLATTPGTASAFFNRGRLLFERGRYKEAVSDFSAAHDLATGDVWPLANRALAYAWLDQLPAAEADIAAASAIEHDNVVVNQARAVVATKKGDPKTAIAAYTAALATDPGDTFSRIRRAELYHSTGNSAAALADTDLLLRQTPDNIKLRLLRANIFKQQGDIAATVAEANAIQRAQPKDSLAQVTAGKIFAAADMTDRAMAAFQAALDIKPNVYIYLNRFEIRRKADIAGRKADIDAAAKLDPTDPYFVRTNAAFAFEQQRYQDAIAGYSAMLAATPGDIFALTGRGMAYGKVGNSAAAVRDFDAAAAAAGTSPDAANSTCWAKASAGVALTSALEDCNRAIKGAPDNGAYYDSRGLVQLRLGRLDAAIADYDAALKLAPRLAHSLYGRSITRARRGDGAGAAVDRAAAIAISPHIAEVFAGYGVEPPAATH